MISLRPAFGVHTTTMITIQLPVDGHYDDDNRYVPGGYGPTFKIPATPIPLGDQDHGTHGKSLLAEPLGERQPAGMKFLSVFKLPINSMVYHGAEAYKITREGDYQAAGFWAAVGQSDTTVQTSTPLVGTEYPEGMTILRGKIEVPLERMLKLYGL